MLIALLLCKKKNNVLSYLKVRPTLDVVLMFAVPNLKLQLPSMHQLFSGDETKSNGAVVAAVFELRPLLMNFV